MTHVPYLVSAILNKGMWEGDICLVCRNEEHEIVQKLRKHDVHIYVPHGTTESFFLKLHLFSTYFKKWDLVLYLDLDFLILGDLNRLVERNTPNLGTHCLLADEENKTIRFTLDDHDGDCLSTIARDCDLDTYNFNSSCMIYKTSFIESQTVDDLLTLAHRLDSVNKHTGAEKGTDQPILNIHFFGKWGQLVSVRYFKNAMEDTLAAHTMRWRAPWYCYLPIYRRYVEMFDWPRSDGRAAPRVTILSTFGTSHDCLSDLVKNAYYPVEISEAPSKGPVCDSSPYVLIATRPVYLSPNWDRDLISCLSGNDSQIVSPVDIDHKSYRKGPAYLKQRVIAGLYYLQYVGFVHRFSWIRWVTLRLVLRGLIDSVLSPLERLLACSAKDHEGMAPFEGIYMVPNGRNANRLLNAGAPYGGTAPENTEIIIAHNVLSSAERESISRLCIPVAHRKPQMYGYLRETGLRVEPGIYT